MGFIYNFIKYLTIFLLVFLIIILFVTPTTALQKTIPQPIIINTNIGQGTTKCTSEIVNCESDYDCNQICIESREGLEMTCQTVNRYTADQINNYGNTQKICAPANAITNCNEKYGGVLTWTGFPEINSMQWNCLCSYPNLASTPGCNLNADVCKGGNFTWDVTDPNNSNPSTATCNCPAGYQLITDVVEHVPRCIPNEIGAGFTANSTKNMYTNNIMN